MAEAGSESPDPLVGEVFGGKYQVVAFMDRGAIGAVYRAIQLSVGREVVLKVLRPKHTVYDADPNFAERFRREAATYGKLRHPNTVTLFDYGEHECGGHRHYYMAMEYVRGQTLRSLLKSEGRVQSERVIEIALQVLSSLREAHGLGIVHRDLKPSNVMITEGDEGARIKVLDFGVAKVLADESTDGAEDALTQTGTLLGSPHYMAPEQMRSGQVDGRTDLYALGCILFELLAGAPPFRGTGVIEICAAHLAKPIPSLGSVARVPLGVPPELEAIVRRCLEKDPRTRYQSAEELARALRLLRGGAELGSVHRRPEASGLASPSDRRIPSSLIWLALILALLVMPTTVFAAGLLALLITLGPGGVPTRPGLPPGPEPIAQAPPETAPAPSVSYRIESVPTGARLWSGEIDLGVTPLELRDLPPGDSPLVLRYAGYRDLVVDREALAERGAVSASLIPKVSPKPTREFKPDVRPIR